MNKYDHALIEDLLPLYMEGLTSEASSAIVNEHLERCIDCKNLYDFMKQGEPDPTNHQPEVDYLKKIKKNLSARKLATAILLGALLIVFGVFIFKNYLFGRQALLHEVKEISYQTRLEGDSSIVLSGSLYDESRAVSHVRVFEPKNMSNGWGIEVFTVEKSFLFDHHDFTVELPWKKEMVVVLQEENNQELLLSYLAFQPTISRWNKDGVVTGTYAATTTIEEYKALDVIINTAADTVIPTPAVSEFTNAIRIEYLAVKPNTDLFSSNYESLVYFIYAQDGKYLLAGYASTFNAATDTTAYVPLTINSKSVDSSDYEMVLEIMEQNKQEEGGF